MPGVVLLRIGLTDGLRLTRIRPIGLRLTLMHRLRLTHRLTLMHRLRLTRVSLHAGEPGSERSGLTAGLGRLLGGGGGHDAKWSAVALILSARMPSPPPEPASR
ncbi:hypothetical protein GCM10010389_08090 [Streptomyces echinoruber]|uniref:Uncharacterized protein n=1 Tax=Streptomyces echinoruber TaxID=68898 RepID=A0A918V695_9ACTN|nr:hypothetical protein GCM10010389_08090 [Streptomyces echinoruber]